MPPPRRLPGRAGPGRSARDELQQTVADRRQGADDGRNEKQFDALQGILISLIVKVSKRGGLELFYYSISCIKIQVNIKHALWRVGSMLLVLGAGEETLTLDLFLGKEAL